MGAGTKYIPALVTLAAFSILFCAVLFSMDSEIGSLQQALSLKYIPTYLVWGLPVMGILGFLFKLLSRKSYWSALMGTLVLSSLLCLILLAGLNPAPQIWSVLMASILVGGYLLSASFISYWIHQQITN